MLFSFFTLTALSKEWLVMSHGTGELIFMTAAIWTVNHYFGKQIGDMIQKHREVRFSLFLIDAYFVN